MAEEEGFTVRDRRTGASEAGVEQPQQDSGSDAQKPANRGIRESLHEAQSAQELDFSTFVISLATSAQVGLGAVPHPETNQSVQNFPAAKQMIDILALLKEKTKGNLTEAESSLLDQVLHNLRIHYVRAMEGKKKSGG
jgi:Domain of unknown function (DUF1844)